MAVDKVPGKVMFLVSFHMGVIHRFSTCRRLSRQLEAHINKIGTRMCILYLDVTMSMRLVTRRKCRYKAWRHTTGILILLQACNPYEIAPPQEIATMCTPLEVQPARQTYIHRCVALVQAVIGLRSVSKTSTYSMFHRPKGKCCDSWPHRAPTVADKYPRQRLP